MNFKSLQNILQDDPIDFCMSKHLISNKNTCRRCRIAMKLVNDSSKEDGKVWRCPTCRSNLSIRKDSIFYASHCTIPTILELLYWWSIKLPVTQASIECGVNVNTAINYYKIFRGVCVELSLGGEKIGGEGLVVEIDEMKLGKRKYHRGKRVEGQWCFGGIVRRENKDDPIHCFIVPVEDRSRNTLLPIIKEYVKDGTTIYSDCWKAYDCLDDEGFVHYSVNHSLHFKDPDTGVHTNTVEGMWNQVRRSLPKFGTKKEYYHAYLAEFVIRNRFRSTKFFDYFIDHLHEFVLWE